MSIHQELRRGLASLKLIFCVAPFLGLLGTVIGILNSFVSVTGSRSTAMAALAERLSRAMVPTLIGLLVSVMAFWFYQYLSGQLEVFDIEMESAASDLVNRLIVQLRRLPLPAAVIGKRGISTAPVEPPRLSITRIYRHGVLELIWPRLASNLDAQLILLGGMLVSFTYGILGWLNYMTYFRPISAKIILGLFVVGGIGLRAGSRFAVIGLQIFLAMAWIRSIIPDGWNLSTTCLVIAPCLLLGSYRAANLINPKRSLWINGWLTVFSIVLPVSIGTLFFDLAFDSWTLADTPSVDLRLQPDDAVLILKPGFVRAIRRGDIVMTHAWSGVQMERVAGLPGDRIQIESGNLIRNGVPVPEISLKASSPVEPGADFPIPASELDPYMSQWRSSRYERDLSRLKPYIVPPESYFLLNDDRANLYDSRVFGPLYRWQVDGRPVLVWRPHTLPRLLPE